MSRKVLISLPFINVSPWQKFELRKYFLIFGMWLKLIIQVYYFELFKAVAGFFIGKQKRTACNSYQKMELDKKPAEV